MNTPGIKSNSRVGAILLCLTTLLPTRADLTREQVTAAKAATGLVITPEGTGTAFCISKSGIFATCAHVVEGAREGSIAIVVSPTGKEEKRYPAKVVKKLKQYDIAVLKIDLDKNVPALPLGDVAGLFETEQLYAFGYPFGKGLAMDEKSYPAVSINVGRVSSLRKKDDVIDAIQLDAQVNPGNSGGPVLDPEGKVIGIVAAGLPGTGINFAIPISYLKSGMDAPVIVIAAPNVEEGALWDPVEFTISLDWVTPPPTEPKVSIEIRGDGPLRTADASKGGDGKYRARIAPVARKKKSGPVKVRVTLDLGSGPISGETPDRGISVGGRAKALSDFEVLQRAPDGKDFLADGRPVGALPELSALSLDLGWNIVTEDARKATKITVQKPAVEVPQILYKAVVTFADGKTASSEEKALNIRSAAPAPLPVIKGKSDFTRTKEIGLPSPNNDLIPTPVPPPVLAGKVELTGTKEIAIPSPINDLVAVRDGRSLLLHMKGTSKLAVFDVLNLKIRGYISLVEDDALFAGGSGFILIINPHEKTIQRYSAETLQKERTISNSWGDIASLTMGRSSPGIAMMISSSGAPGTCQIMAFDAGIMNVISTVDSNVARRLYNANVIVRASADGRTFGICQRGLSPSGFIILTFQDDQFSEFYEHVSAGVLVPNADGSRIFTSQMGVYTDRFVSVVQGNGNWASGVTYLPSYHPMYYIGIPYEAMHGGRDKKGSKSIGVYLTGSSQSLVQTSEGASEMEAATHDLGGRIPDDGLTLDKRCHFYPQLDLLLTVPPTNDKIVAHHLDVRQILDEKGIDYLYVTSIAPLGKVSSPYHYKLEAASNVGGVTFALQTGPLGLTVSSDGVVTWKAPAKPAEETVIVSIKNSSGQETAHTFRIVVTN